jgi:hypothetical protein
VSLTLRDPDPAVSLTPRDPNFSTIYIDFLGEYKAICETALATASDCLFFFNFYFLAVAFVKVLNSFD